MLKALSRTSSASSRNRPWRASQRFSGSRASISFEATEACRYVRLVTMVRTMCFRSQPESMNSQAHQTKRRGLGGRFSLGAEVFAFFRKADAEELLPEPVHGHPGRERVVARHNP